MSCALGIRYRKWSERFFFHCFIRVRHLTFFFSALYIANDDFVLSHWSSRKHARFEGSFLLRLQTCIFQRAFGQAHRVYFCIIKNLSHCVCFWFLNFGSNLGYFFVCFFYTICLKLQQTKHGINSKIFAPFHSTRPKNFQTIISKYNQTNPYMLKWTRIINEKRSKEKWSSSNRKIYIFLTMQGNVIQKLNLPALSLLTLLI